MAALGLATMGWSEASVGDRSVDAGDLQLQHPEGRGPRRRPIHGTDFPEGVLALTWDDGPDADTLELARYLHDSKISGTFFVVGEWLDGISEEPGIGVGVYATGYRHLPILEEVVGLGHRVGNHTTNHTLLDGLPERNVAQQLEITQHAIEGLQKNELPLFRAPGGAWSRSAAHAVESSLGQLVGPIHWDIDAKDWEGSRYCRSESPATECEPWNGASRTRPEVIAHRYVRLAERIGRGIVLFHDRVGDVGSHYALDIARMIIPELERRGFVFAAPILSFGPLQHRDVKIQGTGSGDINGDGRPDKCFTDDAGVWCALASTHGSFKAASLWSAPHLGKLHLVDINGDGRADLCFDDGMCGMAP
jgi:peptidoglycan/xylan/chitin deacetylase (PgdA/CDA1 family)